MTSLEDAVIARIKTHGETFEILVDPDLAYKYRAGEKIKISEVLAAEFIFKDAGKTDKASDEDMKKVFATINHEEIADKILHKGEIQLTSEKKKELIENRKKQVIQIIAANAVNPQTGTPHPPDRIEKAMDEAKFHIDLHKSANEQVEIALKAIRPIIPIKFETVELAVKIPGEFAGKMFKLLHEFGEVKNEEWRGQDQYCVIEIPGGMQDEFYNQLNNKTHGEAQVKKIEKK